MVKWRDCKLGDLLEVRHGFAFLGEHFGSAGTHVVLTPGNFLEEGGFKERADKAKWYSGPIPEEYVLNEGDLIVAMTEQAEGLLGSSAIIPRSGVYLHNQRLGLVQIRDLEQTDRRFIYYLFNTKLVRQQIRGSASGTKIRHTAPSRIADVKVSVPPLQIQRHIAGILSAYDELIENSQRRIKILESMARAIYREWFVHFRFPGQGSVPRVPSPLGEIPQGWEVKKINEFAEFIRGFEPGSDAYKKEPGFGRVRFLRVGDLSKRDSGLFIDEHLVQGRILQPLDIAITLDGSVGEVRLGLDGAYSSGIRRVDVKDRSRLGWIFLYQLLLSDAAQATIQAHAKGTTIKHAGSAIAALEFASPPNTLVNEFETIASPMMRQVLSLQQQVDNLRRTRDLLLPRLISGEIDLEASAA